jgi:hypothetical protein
MDDILILNIGFVVFAIAIASLFLAAFSQSGPFKDN